MKTRFYTLWNTKTQDLHPVEKNAYEYAVEWRIFSTREEAIDFIKAYELGKHIVVVKLNVERC